MRNRVNKIKDFDNCGQKKSYSNKDDAWMDASKQNRESFGNIIKKPYRCKFCKNWHLTTLDL